MQENRRTANQNAEVQQMTELQRQNARAEKLLDQNRKGRPSVHTIQAYVGALLESYIFYEINTRKRSS